MKIRYKLLLSFTVMIALLISISAISFYQMKQTQVAEQETSRDANFRYSLKALQYSLAGLSNDERAYLLNGDKNFTAQMAEKEATIMKLFNSLKAKPGLDPSSLKFITELEQGYKTYAEASQRVRSSMRAGRAAEAVNIHFNEERQARKQLESSLNQLIGQTDQKTTTDSLLRRKVHQQQEISLFILCAAAVIIAWLTAWLVARSITKPIRVINQQMREIADGEGDLSREIGLRSKDELGEMAVSYNHMIRNLRSILIQAKDTAIQAAASSEQLTASAEHTTKATENIMESTGQIVTSAEQEQAHVNMAVQGIQRIYNGIQMVKDRNEEVSVLSASSLEASVQGASAIQDILIEMQEIQTTVQEAAAVIQLLGDRSQQINGITSMITELANRTNILSLNAGIEAARAGEQGRGFAIVAGEIRELARQSQESAERINELIQGIVSETGTAVTAMHSGTKKVSVGLTKTIEMGRKFHTIEAQAAEVSAQVDQNSETIQKLSSESQQLVSFMEEVAKSSKEVAAASQNNSASTEEQLASMEEITSSAHELSRLADDLHGVLSKFKLN
ncbi:methyl-accepting chemotaxis protein [Paenibacillus sp. YPG26]|uniref:methyl-accepting chemotaxis protein n=1 Tax=Paenibacillus sp. YPG26 TaxID=2878915 RepID=UPI00203A9484|nr:methyl-accepting chemotaxis protein [Paenibacillus sp. YPG26]USB34074.1 methyl-accepting chemotaxis protein [Paenibacillus sp. YPG26]